MLVCPWMSLSLSDEKSITSFRFPETMGVNSSLAVARSLGPTFPTLMGGKNRVACVYKTIKGIDNTTKEQLALKKLCAFSFFPKTS